MFDGSAREPGVAKIDWVGLESSACDGGCTGFALGVVHRGCNERGGVSNDIRALSVVCWRSSSQDMAADAFHYSYRRVASRCLVLSHDSNVGIKGINFLLRFDGRD